MIETTQPCSASGGCQGWDQIIGAEDQVAGGEDLGSYDVGL